MSNLKNNPEAIDRVFIAEGLKKDKEEKVMKDFFSVVMLVLVAVICFSAVGVSATAADKSRTSRTYVRADGTLTALDSEAVRIGGGVKIGFWGEPGKPLSKAPSIQKWIRKDGVFCYNALFASETDAKAFLANSNREETAGKWRVILDAETPTPDPKVAGASQVFLSMP